MTTSVRHGAVIVLLLFVAACGRSGPISPTATNQPPVIASPPPAPATNFPPLSGPSRTFVFDRGLSYATSEYTKQTRLVLYDNGAFFLQYPSVANGGFRGGYGDANGVITFEWEGWSRATWGATGTLKGDSLTVQYNVIMQLDDFEDAVYILMR